MKKRILAIILMITITNVTEAWHNETSQKSHDLKNSDSTAIDKKLKLVLDSYDFLVSVKNIHKSKMDSIVKKLYYTKTIEEFVKDSLAYESATKEFIIAEDSVSKINGRAIKLLKLSLQQKK